MSRPVVTALLLEELRRTGVPIRLAKGALITPAARDWLKEHPGPVIWENGEKAKHSLAVVLEPSRADARAVRSMLERMNGGVEVIAPAAAGAGPLASAVRRLCGKIVRQEVTKGVVFTAEAGVPLVVANKHHGIRAMLGSGLAEVEDAIRELGVNVLVIETRGHAIFQTRQMIERLLNGPTSAPAEMAAALESIERSGGRENW